jgi:hypothetical protein
MVTPNSYDPWQAARWVPFADPKAEAMCASTRGAHLRLGDEDAQQGA